jgi:hypothetical protein
MKGKMLELKQWLKKEGLQIKEAKNKHKNNQRSKNNNELMWPLHKMSRDYRHHHIAYSELKGRTRSEIENPRDNNLPNEDIILSIKKKYFDEQETLRNSA